MKKIIILGLLLSSVSYAQTQCTVGGKLGEHSYNPKSLEKALSIKGYTPVKMTDNPAYVVTETCETTYHDCSDRKPSPPRCSGSTYTDHNGTHSGSSSNGTYQRTNGHMSECRPSYVSYECHPHTTVDYCELSLATAAGELITSFKVGGGELGFLGGWKRYKKLPACPVAN